MAEGRTPVKLTKRTSDKICGMIRLGNYVETAAAYGNISKQTFYNWMRAGAKEEELREKGNPKTPGTDAYVKFVHDIEMALAESETRDVAVIHRASSTQWQAAAWRLERRFPQRWGRKRTEMIDAEADIPEDSNQVDLNARVKEEVTKYGYLLDEIPE